MIISKDKVVSLTYELRLDSIDGEIVESVKKEAPLTFLFGAGNLLPSLRKTLKG
jgi:FKBP-type peptidyl-prolyl cis-trans isomerase SlyD